jgi:hypothetical protein
MGKTRYSRHQQSAWRVLLAALSIVLILFVGIVAVAHTHASADVSHADCGLCATAHVSIQITGSPVVLHSELTFFSVPPAPLAERPRTLCRFALFSRPPPVDAYPA